MGLAPLETLFSSRINTNSSSGCCCCRCSSPESESEFESEPGEQHKGRWRTRLVPISADHSTVSPGTEMPAVRTDSTTLSPAVGWDAPTRSHASLQSSSRSGVDGTIRNPTDSPALRR
eukprot:jgi/Psemu1/302245/fgenesh1_kg.63_\